MTEQELRALVRAAIARHAASTAASPGPMTPLVVGPGRHFSHDMFQLAAGSDGDGACIIEPAVACNHCGYCKSIGH